MTNTYNLIELAQKGDKTAEKKLIDDNIPLVHSCARSLNCMGYEYEDLIQVGSIGLLKAIRNFNTSLGLRLSTYAVPLIMGEIKRYIRDNTSIKVSRSLRELWMKMNKERRALETELMREPTVCELAQRLGVSVEKLTLAMEASSPCDYLERKISADEKGELHLADTLKANGTPDDEIDKIALGEALKKLDDRDKKIILLRYFRVKTQTEVSHIIGVSQVQISRIEKRVIASLKKSMQ